MPDTTFDLELRPATLDDARLVADLETARDPSEAADPARRVHWWRMTDELEKGMRQVAVRKRDAVRSFGYREVSRMRTSELDLIENRDRFLAAREECRRQMAEQGVRMLLLS